MAGLAVDGGRHGVDPVLLVRQAVVVVMKAGSIVCTTSPGLCTPGPKTWILLGVVAQPVPEVPNGLPACI